MIVDKLPKMAEPTPDEWGEIERLFRNEVEILRAVKFLRTANSLCLDKCGRFGSQARIHRANEMLRYSSALSIRKFRVQVDPETDNLPTYKQIVHLYEVEETIRLPRKPA